MQLYIIHVPTNRFDDPTYIPVYHPSMTPVRLCSILTLQSLYILCLIREFGFTSISALCVNIAAALSRDDGHTP